MSVFPLPATMCPGRSAALSNVRTLVVPTQITLRPSALAALISFAASSLTL